MKSSSPLLLQQPRLFEMLTFLGTSSGVPTPFRNTQSYFLHFNDGGIWMIDCGEGTQHRVQQSKAVSLGRLERIFICHGHGDHCYGLPGLLCSLGMTWGKRTAEQRETELGGGAAAKKNGDKKNDDDDVIVEEEEDEEEGRDPSTFTYQPYMPDSEYLEIVGPKGLAAYLRSAFQFSQACLPFKYRVTELLPFGDKDQEQMQSTSKQQQPHWCEGQPQFIVADKDTGCWRDIVTPASPASKGVTVSAAPLKHPVQCYGIAVREAEKPGALDAAKAAQMGVKGPLLGKLKAGESVTVTIPAAAGAAGTAAATITVNPADVVGAPTPGRTVLLLSDSCDSNACAHILREPKSSIASGEGAAAAAASSGNDNSTANSSSPFSATAWSRVEPELVVHESTFDDKSSALALPRGHSTARMAGAFAERVRARRLIITHFSARYPPEEKDPGPIAQLISEARAGAQAENAMSAMVVEAAADFRSFSLARKKEGGTAAADADAKKKGGSNSNKSKASTSSDAREKE